ncbi:MAG: cohesin domain-containing protein [Ruminococcus sp.]|nr:cohesin domain-containing protein [Ruminococcus sp.]
MNLKFHKRALSAAVALLTLTSAVTTVNAAKQNEIRIKTSSETVNAGDTFDVTVELSPDSTGVSCFTLDIYYDSDSLTLNTQQSEEYSVSGDFEIVTNFDYSDDCVRIIGANLSDSNVTENTVIETLSFTANDNYSESAYIDASVVALVYTSGDSYINADYTTSSLTLSISDETDPDEDEADLDEEKTDSVEASEEGFSQESEDSSENEDSYSSSTEAEISSEADEEDTSYSEEATDTDEQANSSEALFSYEQSGGDYNNEEALQYIFTPSDYSDTDSSLVNISVSVSASSTAIGGIGMQTSSGWTIYSCELYGGETVWAAENVDLSDVYGDIAVQLYYLKDNSTFEINSISITSALEATDTSADEDESTDSSLESETDEDSTEEETEVESSETSSETESAAEAEESEISSDSTEESSSDEIDTEEQLESNQTNSLEATTEVESAVAEASEQADSNPGTGVNALTYVCGGIMALCVLQIISSVLALIRKKV